MDSPLSRRSSSPPPNVGAGWWWWIVSGPLPLFPPVAALGRGLCDSVAPPAAGS